MSDLFVRRGVPAAPCIVVAPEVVTIGGLIKRHQDQPRLKNLKPATQLFMARSLLHLLRHLDLMTPIERVTVVDLSDIYESLLLSKDEGGCGLAHGVASITARRDGPLH